MLAGWLADMISTDGTTGIETGTTGEILLLLYCMESRRGAGRGVPAEFARWRECSWDWSVSLAAVGAVAVSVGPGMGE